MIDIDDIAARADLIVSGYAFLPQLDGRLTVLNLNRPTHVSVFLPSGDLEETSMDDIEIAIVRDHLERNREFLGDADA